MSSEKSVDEILHRLGGRLTFVANEMNVDISGRIESDEYVSEIMITCTAHLHGSMLNSKLKEVEITISEVDVPIALEGVEKPALGVIWKSGPTTNMVIFFAHQKFTQLLSSVSAVNAVESQKLVISVLPSKNVKDWNGEYKIGINEVTVSTRTL